jgi:hypothetical protein
MARFGSDWDLDLGWVLLWWGIIAGIVIAIYFLTNLGISTNEQNVSRDKYYADNCKTVFEVPNNGGRAFQCQNK